MERESQRLREEHLTEEDSFGLSDVLDNLTKYRRSLGFIADRIADPQASAIIWMIEEAMEETEMMLAGLIQKTDVSN